MENKQTAVEWLIDQYIKDGLFKEGVYEQAKEKEKQQIIDAYVAQMECTDKQLMKVTIGEGYYNETYKQNG